MQTAVGISLLALCFDQLFLASYCLAELFFLLPPSLSINVPVVYTLSDVMIWMQIFCILHSVFCISYSVSCICTILYVMSVMRMSFAAAGKVLVWAIGGH